MSGTVNVVVVMYVPSERTSGAEVVVIDGSKEGSCVDVGADEGFSSPSAQFFAVK